MQVAKLQYEVLRDLAKQLDQVLDEIKGTESTDDGNVKYWNHRMGVLADVMLKGSIVTVEEWADIGREHGYDARGLGGYFAGAKASMVSIGHNRRAITDAGMKDVKNWLDGRLSVKPWDSQLNKYGSLAVENK